MASNRDEQVLTVQHFVVFEVVQKCIGHTANLGCQKHGCAFYAGRRRHKNSFQEIDQAK